MMSDADDDDESDYLDLNGDDDLDLEVDIDEEEDKDTPASKSKKKKRKKRAKGENEVTWDPHGPDAVIVGKAIVEGRCNPNEFASARENIPDIEEWLESGKYTTDNIRRNYKNLLKNINTYLIVGTSKSAVLFCIEMSLNSNDLTACSCLRVARIRTKA